MIYRVVPEVRTGDGSEGNPWGVNQLVSPPPYRPGVAMNAMSSNGDELHFDGGTYQLVGSSVNQDGIFGLLVPRASNCVLRSKEGEVARVENVDGYMALVGTLRHDYFISHGLKVLGMDLRANNPNAAVEGHGGIVYIRGYNDTNRVQDVEIAYCKLVAQDIPWLSDNHNALRSEFVNNSHIHHCELTGSTGATGNSTGYTEYHSSNVLFEDNYVHGNCNGVFTKNSPLNNIYRRNLILDNWDRGFRKNFEGSGFTFGGPTNIYDNIIDSYFNCDTLTRDLQFHHNLILNGDRIINHVYATSYRLEIWNNILLGETSALNPYWSGYVPYPGSPAALTYLDYNLYVSKNSALPVPRYPHSNQNYTLAQFQALGYEQHSLPVAGGLAAIYDDVNTYDLKTLYRTLGRDGDIIGPHDPELVLDISRYGPQGTIPEEEPEERILAPYNHNLIMGQKILLKKCRTIFS